MSSRERNMAIGVALLAVAFFAYKGHARFRDVRQQNYRKLENVERELGLALEAAERGRKAQGRIRAWGKQSLPTDLDVAKSLYEDWLREQLTESGLSVSEINDKSPGSANKRFQEISFEVKAGGSLGRLSNFLYRFYRAGHLHRISEANLTPTGSRKSLSILLTIDALLLENCKREDRLTTRSSELELPPLKKIRRAIVSRNIFAVYQSPLLRAQENGEMTGDQDRVLAQARMTSMTYGRGGWQMSIRMHDSGEILFFREGDPIKIGRFSGKIVELDGRRAIVTVRKQRVLVRLGQSLAQAQPLADQAG